jgi:hypothetical protein
MESHGVPGKITLSREAWACVEKQVRGEWETIKVKGKGEQCVFRLAAVLAP